MMNNDGGMPLKTVPSYHSSDLTVNVLCSKEIISKSESTAKFGFALERCSQFLGFFNSTVTKQA